MNNKLKTIDYEFEYVGSCISQTNFNYNLNWFQRILVRLKLKKYPKTIIIDIEDEMQKLITDKNNILSDEEK